MSLRRVKGLLPHVCNHIPYTDATQSGTTHFGLFSLGTNLLSEAHFLPQEGEAGVVGGEAQHHEIGVEAVKAVARVGIVARLTSFPTNKVHDLVLALARAVVAREVDVHVLPRS